MEVPNSAYSYLHLAFKDFIRQKCLTSDFLWKQCKDCKIFYQQIILLSEYWLYCWLWLEKKNQLLKTNTLRRSLSQSEQLFKYFMYDITNFLKKFFLKLLYIFWILFAPIQFTHTDHSHHTHLLHFTIHWKNKIINDELMISNSLKITKFFSEIKYLLGFLSIVRRCILTLKLQLYFIVFQLETHQFNLKDIIRNLWCALEKQINIEIWI